MINYYTDGSYSPQKNIGVYGFMLNNDIYLWTTCKKNTQCEYLSVQMALRHAIENNNKDIKIFTDCSGIINTINKNKKDKWPKLFELLNKFNGNIDWIKVKGHSKKINKNNNDLEFQKIDKAVRKKLRELVNES